MPEPRGGAHGKIRQSQANQGFYIFDPNTEKKITVTESQFREYYRPIYRVFAFAKRHHQCACSKWWLCGGDCNVCDWARDPEQDTLARLYYDLEIMNSNRYETDDPHTATERKEFREKAEAFLQLLSAELRRIYDLHEEGKSQDEIADVMGVSQDTIHRRLKKIKEDFRLFYEG
nr:sigma-70 family RNA polymerase sigma factor [uncultured Sphaerochaeta sp.]